MVVTTNNTIKILLTFNEFNIEKLISDNLEALSLSEQNYFYVNLIGKIVFYLITSNSLVHFLSLSYKFLYQKLFLKSLKLKL